MKDSSDNVRNIFRNLVTKAGFVEPEPKKLTAKKFSEFLVKSGFFTEEIPLRVQLDYNAPNHGFIERIEATYSKDHIILRIIFLEETIK